MKKFLVFFSIILLMLISIISFYPNCLLASSIDASNISFNDNTKTAWESLITEIDLTTDEIHTLNILSEVLASDSIDPILPTIPSDVVDPHIIFGQDDRQPVSDTTKYPFKAIGKLESRFENTGNRLFGGTAFLIAKNVAVTCGHCVYDHKNNGGRATELVFTPGLNAANVPYGSTTVKNYLVPQGWINNNNKNYDWAIIILNDPIGNKVGGTIGLNNFTNLSDFNGYPVTISGYPLDKSYDGNKQFYTLGTTISATEYMIKTKMDITCGMSGSPMYYDNKMAVGIVSREDTLIKNYNYATKVTALMIQTARNAINDNA